MLAALEDNGGRALAFASGSAATASMLQSIGSGAHVVSINDVYGGTFRYLSQVASHLQGIETTFLDFDLASDDDVINAIRPNTKVSIPALGFNPRLTLLSFPFSARVD
jgi:cystathionine gamma-lyase